LPVENALHPHAIRVAEAVAGCQAALPRLACGSIYRKAGRVTQGFQATTSGITVAVEVVYLTEKSNPAAGYYVWAYHITIENRSDAAVQLLSRTWRITDAHGRHQHVHGDGVVGEQPVLRPGESFAYSSGTPLQTASGFMVGAYHMVRLATGEAFDVAIPLFSLDSPHQDMRLQ
jgi:ApaG protein